MRYHIRLSGVILAVFSLLMLCSAAYPAVIYVAPGGNDANDGSSWANAKVTIAGGIEASEAGDEIWVAMDTYEERVFIKSGIEIYGGFAGTESQREDRNWDTNLTIIDSSTLASSDNGSTVTFARGAAANTRLDGFVVKGGTGTVVGPYSYGGGIYCSDYSSPTIANNLIKENTATNGGGIYCYDWSSPVIIGNKIRYNEAEDWGGGIFTRYNPLAIISDNIVEWNQGWWGAGIACFNAAVNMTNNRVWHNTPSRYVGSSGGGIYLEYLSSSTVTGNIVVANTASNGGGIHLSNFQGNLVGNRMTANSGMNGGGLYVSNTSGVIANNVINGNEAENFGGGIYCRDYSHAKIINNTIVSNVAESNGGGISFKDSSPVVANNIVSFNSSGLHLSNSTAFKGAPPGLRNNCVYKNNDADYVAVNRGQGDIQFDPKFGSFKYGNLHIQPDSPCVNAGFDSVAELPEYDVDGNARKLGGRVDIGADESDGTVWIDTPNVTIYVSKTGSDDNDGMNWAAAKATVQGGIDTAATVGGDVWICEGEYDEHLYLMPYVHLFGGFSGDEIEKNNRDFLAYESIIFPQTNGRIIEMQPGHGLNTIDGLTLTGANAGGDDGVDGGAVYCHNSSPVIANNRITDCVAVNGGAIACDLLANPIVTYNTIQDCKADEMGGAIYAAGQSSPIIKNNRISDNAAATAGAGMALTEECSSIVANNIIEGNSLPVDGTYGGAILCMGNKTKTSPIIYNNTIIRNVAAEGGAIYVTAASPVIANNIFAYNRTGLRVRTGSKPAIKNNCVFENMLYSYSGTFPGTGDIEANPQFVDYANGNYHLKSNSKCIDAGDDTVVQEGDRDLDLGPRIYGAYPDMGVDEWRGLFNQSLYPNSGALSPNKQITLTSAYSHPEGNEELQVCYFLLNSQLSGINGIMVKYEAGMNFLYLKSDDNTSWLGGFAPGSNNVIENSRAKLYCLGTTVDRDNETLTIAWRIEIKPVMSTRSCTAWMMVSDFAGLKDGWDPMGEFEISFAPTNDSISPKSGAVPVGTKIALTSRYSDLDGYTRIDNCELLINTTLSKTNAAYVRYDAKTNRLYVRKDDNSGWVGGFAPGTSNVIDNSRIRLYCRETVVSGSGPTRTIKWSVMLKSPLSGNSCGAWMLCLDNSGQYEAGTEDNNGFKRVGTLVLSQAPVNTSLSPNSGTLVSDRDTVFSAKYTDPDGHGDIAGCYLMMNRTQTGVNGIFVRYDAVENKLYLKNDTSMEWIGGYTPGDSRLIENKTCKLDVSQTTITRSGNTITVNWKIRVKSSAMAGKTLRAYMLTIDKSELRAEWEQRGLFKVGLPN